MAITKRTQTTSTSDKYEQTHTIGIMNKDDVVVAWVNVAINRRANAPVLDEETLISALQAKGLNLRVTDNNEVPTMDTSADL